MEVKPTIYWKEKLTESLIAVGGKPTGKIPDLPAGSRFGMFPEYQ
jgi:hypothetical protein